MNDDLPIVTIDRHGEWTAQLKLLLDTSTHCPERDGDCGVAHLTHVDIDLIFIGQL